MQSRRISVRGIIFKDGKLLCVVHRNPDGSARPNYATPGGGLEDDESLVAGVQRELIEETGIAPKVGKLLFIQQFISTVFETHETVDFFFHIENPEDYETINLSGTTHGELEINSIGFVDPATVPLLPDFLRTIDIAGYINEDRPVALFDNLNEKA